MSQLFQQLPPVIPRNSEFFRTNFFRRNNKCTMAWIIIIIIATILRRHRARFTSKRASVYNPEYTHSRRALCLTTRAPLCAHARARERARKIEKEREREKERGKFAERRAVASRITGCSSFWRYVRWLDTSLLLALRATGISLSTRIFRVNEHPRFQ